MRAARMFGLTRGTTRRPHRARRARVDRLPDRATCSTRWSSDSGDHARRAAVDGGAAANNLLMQFQADILGVPVVRPTVLETTALGAGYLAGLAVGYWKDAADVGANRQIDRIFEPAMPRERVGRTAGRLAEGRHADQSQDVDYVREWHELRSGRSALWHTCCASMRLPHPTAQQLLGSF